MKLKKSDDKDLQFDKLEQKKSLSEITKGKRVSVLVKDFKF